MEKITEKLLLERGAPKPSKLEQIKTLNLSKLGLRTEDVPVALLSRLSSLEQLDLSGNRVQEMPVGLRLPRLRTLDLSNNDLEDVTALEDLAGLEELRLEDNLYLTVNDNYKLMVLLPRLRVHNGKDISTTANHVRFIAGENLKRRVVGVWESSAFSLPDPSKRAEMSKMKKEFVQKAVQEVRYGPMSINGYTKWRVERIATEFFDSLVQPEEEVQDTEVAAEPKAACTDKRKHAPPAESGPGSPPKKPKLISLLPLDHAVTSPPKPSRVQLTPQKLDRPAPSTASTPRPATPARPPPEASPRKSSRIQKPVQTAASSTPTRGQARASESPRKALREQQNREPRDARSETPTNGIKGTPNRNTSQEPVSLKAHLALQCHSRNDSPDDLSTQLWACAFQPPDSNSAGVGAEERVVATCGGDSVCLIDCETGKVLKKHKVPGEEFFSLAWSSVLMSREGGGSSMRRCRILAAAGKRGVVKLIHPRANVAYGEFRASSKAVSILRFSPRQGNFLFTGAYDKKIVMWDLGGVDHQYNYKVIQLLVLEATSTPLHLCPPPSAPDTHLIAACENGLHCYNTQLSKNTMKRSAEFEVTFPVYEKEDKEHHYHTIDGLAFLTDDIAASKSHMQGSIYLWSWRATRAQRPGRKQQVCAVVLAELQWSSTDVPYLSLSTCPGQGYVVCGDDTGRLWRYHITDLLKDNFNNRNMVPVTEVVEWPVKEKVKEASINSVAMDPELRYLVALTDKNIVVIWKRAES